MLTNFRCFRKKTRKRQQTIEEDQIIRPFPQAMPQLEKLYKKQDEVTAMRNGLSMVHALIQKIQTASIKADAKGEKLKLLWVAALRGDANDDGCRLYLGADNLKQYAWSYSRAQRVNAQYADIEVKAYITEDGEDQVLKFDGANLDARSAGP